jgi:septum formation protein
LVLASTSPRRREILALLGIPFEVVAPRFSEVTRQRPVELEVLDFAIGKARSVASEYPGALIIGSDTMISLEGGKFGKPVDADDAARMLRAMAGKTHRIYTSVAIIDGAGAPGLRHVDEVRVKMRAFGEPEIAAYIACNESLDKAGAYSIQGEGSRLIESIEGDYLAAVGMPLRPVAQYLRECGFVLPLNVERLYAEKSFRNWACFHIGPLS